MPTFEIIFATTVALTVSSGVAASSIVMFGDTRRNPGQRKVAEKLAQIALCALAGRSGLSRVRERSRRCALRPAVCLSVAWLGPSHDSDFTNAAIKFVRASKSAFGGGKKICLKVRDEARRGCIRCNLERPVWGRLLTVRFWLLTHIAHPKHGPVGDWSPPAERRIPDIARSNSPEVASPPDDRRGLFGGIAQKASCLAETANLAQCGEALIR